MEEIEINLSAVFLITINSSTLFSLNEYALLIIVATISYGLNYNIIKSCLSGVKSVYITTVSVSFAGLLGMCVLFFSGYESYIEVGENKVFPLLSLVILGVLGTSFALYIQNLLIQKSSAVFASSVNYLIPVVAVLWGVLDGERLVFLHYLGMLGILIGVLILNKSIKLNFSSVGVRDIGVRNKSWNMFYVKHDRWNFTSMVYVWCFSSLNILGKALKVWIKLLVLSISLPYEFMDSIIFYSKLRLIPRILINFNDFSYPTN